MATEIEQRLDNERDEAVKLFLGEIPMSVSFSQIYHDKNYLQIERQTSFKLQNEEVLQNIETEIAKKISNIINSNQMIIDEKINISKLLENIKINIGDLNITRIKKKVFENFKNIESLSVFISKTKEVEIRCIKK